jgi:AcrR family transcriptional regulator
MRTDGVRARAAATTRALIIDVARRLFVVDGYAAVSIERIVREAGVTRGALYHHFNDKRALFEAVFQAVEIAVSARANPESPVGQIADSWTRYRLRMQGFLDAILKAEFYRILLIDGPAVLGWAEWRRHESEYGLGAIERALDAAMDEGVIVKRAVSPLAHIILAAIHETALFIVNAPDRLLARQEAGGALDAFLAGLARPPRSAPMDVRDAPTPQPASRQMTGACNVAFRLG